MHRFPNKPNCGNSKSVKNVFFKGHMSFPMVNLPLNSTTWGPEWPIPRQGKEEVPHWWRCWSTDWGKEPEEPTWLRPYGWFPPYTCEQPKHQEVIRWEGKAFGLYWPLVYWWFLQLQAQRGEHTGLADCGKSSHPTCKQSPEQCINNDWEFCLLMVGMKTYPGSTDSKQQGTGRREDAGALAKCKKIIILGGNVM